MLPGVGNHRSFRGRSLNTELGGEIPGDVREVAGWRGQPGLPRPSLRLGGTGASDLTVLIWDMLLQVPTPGALGD